MSTQPLKAPLRLSLRLPLCLPRRPLQRLPLRLLQQLPVRLPQRHPRRLPGTLPPRPPLRPPLRLPVFFGASALALHATSFSPWQTAALLRAHGEPEQEGGLCGDQESSFVRRWFVHVSPVQLRCRHQWWHWWAPPAIAVRSALPRLPLRLSVSSGRVRATLSARAPPWRLQRHAGRTT